MYCNILVLYYIMLVPAVGQACRARTIMASCGRTDMQAAAGCQAV